VLLSAHHYRKTGQWLMKQTTVLHQQRKLAEIRLLIWGMATQRNIFHRWVGSGIFNCRWVGLDWVEGMVGWVGLSHLQNRDAAPAQTPSFVLPLQIPGYARDWEQPNIATLTLIACDPRLLPAPLSSTIDIMNDNHDVYEFNCWYMLCHVKRLENYVIYWLLE